MAVIHLLTRTEYAPNEPDVFHALCGYESGTKKQFADTFGKMTCEECLQKIFNAVKEPEATWQ